ncbi:asparagine synthase-related protein [Halapricum desulfuricans]|uniref:Putative asparagine synthetase [glutamine-hydrolyzing] n=1 Tax=Halapricum desulfuricans TaxID=2841257 RepID=A0A897NUH5_9EURY|nr:asparagine synthase-related protein [Halapricum desulfuricans]QSG16074.1 Asparagine synthase (glutamine-hydrolyzing) [Halapricum desulfuricans]
MTGIVGGTVDRAQLEGMVETLPQEPWYETERFEAGELGLALKHHGEKDPKGYTFWGDGQAAGVIDGAVSNRDALGWDDREIFERLLRSPEATLRALDGPFTIACVDAADDRVILATDRIGSRIPLYTTERGFAFASRLAPFLGYLDEAAIDTQGVSDLLLMGHMWSDTTLLEGVNAVHPATVIEYRAGEIDERRYWKPDYRPAKPTDEYRHEWTNAYQRSAERTVNTMAGDVGLWLSGGLDSRATANELARADDGTLESLVTYTYDANPGGGVNLRLAAETAEVLGLDNETVPLTVEQFTPMLEKAVSVTDGMLKWNTLLNLTATFNIDDRDPDIMLEGIAGSFAGHHLSRHHLTEPSSLVESMYASEATLTAEAVEDLLTVPVDPLGSFRKEARRIDEPTLTEGIVDAHYQNYFPRLAHASNPVARNQVGTRVPYADGEFLSQAAKLPVSWRMGALPFSDGELIYGLVEPKIQLIRTLNADLAEIPYERSRLKPSMPYPLHVIGFYTATAIAQLLSRPTYGSASSRTETWYNTHEEFRTKIDDLLDAVGERPFIDDEAVAAYREQLGDGADMNVISALTTLEIWLQQHFDRHRE